MKKSLLLKSTILFILFWCAFAGNSQSIEVLEKLNKTYKELGPFVNGYAVGEYVDENYYLIDTQGKTVNKSAYNLMYNPVEGMARVMLKKSVSGSYHEGNSRFTTSYSNWESIWGFLSTDGNEIPLTYASVKDFSSGLAAVQDSKTLKWGFINKQNELVVPFQKCSYTTSFTRKGYATLVSQGRQIVIDQKGKEIKTLKFKEVGEEIHDGMIYFLKSDKYGFLDETYNEVIPAIYENISSKEFREGLCAVKKNGKWGYINTQNELTIPLLYEQVKAFSGGYATVLYQNNWIVINKEGIITSTINPDIYSMEPLSHGLIKVKSGNDKWGCIDTRGNIIIPLAFKDLDILEDGTVSVYNGGFGGFGLFDSTGKEIVKIGVSEIPVRFKEGYALIVKDSKYGYINRIGKLVVPAEYDKATPFKNGKAKVYKGNQGWEITVTKEKEKNYNFNSVVDEILNTNKNQ